MKWISAKDGLPEDERLKVVRYVVSQRYLGIALSRYRLPSNQKTQKYWCFEFGNTQQTKVTHWMSLPEPPKENNDG